MDTVQVALNLSLSFGLKKEHFTCLSVLFHSSSLWEGDAAHNVIAVFTLDLVSFNGSVSLGRRRGLQIAFHYTRLKGDHYLVWRESLFNWLGHYGAANNHFFCILGHIGIVTNKQTTVWSFSKNIKKLKQSTFSSRLAKALVRVVLCTELSAKEESGKFSGDFGKDISSASDEVPHQRSSIL